MQPVLSRRNDMFDYDLIVIGAGPGGYVAAIRAAQLGMKTAIIEKDSLGGTCVNRGCIPAKTLLHSAELVREMQNSAVFGVSAENVSFDFAALHARRESVSETLRGGIQRLLKSNKVTQITGTASILGANRVKVQSAEGESILTAGKILIASGSKPSTPPIPGLELPGVVTSDALMGQTPDYTDSLVIIGGGVIGVEIASVYSALGCKVTIVEALDRILANMDREISQSLNALFRKRGVTVHAGSAVQRIEAGEDGMLNCVFADKKGEQTVQAKTILVAVGRKPCTDGLFEEGFSVDMERGRILVDDSFATSVPDVYAIGDVSSRVQLAHAASAQGIAAVEAMQGLKPSVCVENIPACIYTSPEIAAIGMTADEAKAAGRTVKTGKYVMTSNGRTLIDDGERGFVKVVADAETDQVLGVQMMCQRATDLISVATQAVDNGLTVAQMRRVMFPHPTFAEGLGEALEAVDGQSIHSVKAI